ncbi:ISL3 family transposase [Gloeocapsa sp. BRSZ]
MEVLFHLLPDSSSLQLKSWLIDKANPRITLSVCSTQVITQCPVCAHPTHRVHSHYERTLADLPLADYSITLQLRVRKFFCLNKQCFRRIFTERIATVAAPWARRTQRMTKRLTAIGLALGGAAGERLSQQLGCAVSRNTILQLVSRLPLPPIVTPQTLGVDDFSFRKRETYGTVLVDLERSRPIALLGDRETETLAAWLLEHPGVQVVSRDRSKAYKAGIIQGAPEAIQVADRFHLLQNLAETLDRVFNLHGKSLKAVEAAHSFSSTTRPDGTVFVPIALPCLTVQEQQRTEQRRTRRLSTYQQVWHLHRQGYKAQAIARQLGIGKTSVFRYLRTPNFPERQGRSDRGRSVLSPYKEYILKRWNSGCYDTKELFEKIQQRGYSGSYDTVARYTRRLRQAQGLKLRQRLVSQPLPKVAQLEKRPLTARRAAMLVLQRQELHKSDDEQLIIRLKAQHPDLSTAIELAQSFAQMVRHRLPERLDSWLAQAIHSSLSPFVRFAQRLHEDYDAVKAGVTLPVSNGPVEGHINRLKMLKRQMYGRAGIDLLTRRFLLA